MLHQLKAYAKTFFSYAGKSAVLAILLIFAGALLEGIGILFIVPILELFSGNSSTGLAEFVAGILDGLGLRSRESQLVFGLAVFIALLIIRNLIGWMRDVRMMMLSQGFVDNWRSRLFSALASASWSRVVALQRTDIEHAITNDVNRLSQGTTQILRGSVSLVLMVVQIIVAFVLSPLLTLLVFIFILAAAALLLPLINRARRLGQLVTTAGRGVHSVLGHFLSGLKLAKAHGREQDYASRFDDEIIGLRRQLIGFSSDHAFARSVFQVTSGVVACLVIVLGVFVLETPIAVLTVILLIMARLTGPFLTLLQSLQSFANMLPAFQSLQKMEHDLRGMDRVPKGQAPDEGPMSKGPASIELQKVTFRHEAQAEPVLRDVHMKIQPGEFVALVGPSGAGKTTLVDLIVGLLEPSSGTVLVDGNNAGTDRRSIAYVPQDPFLFDMSLRANLLWASDNRSDEEIWQTLKLVKVEKSVRALDQGLETRCGERGQSFSGGERQRLCLARALLGAPRLLILDEATNAVDLELEAEILENLYQLRSNMTILMITHRLSSIERADKVFIIRNAKITQSRSKRASDLSVLID